MDKHEQELVEKFHNERKAFAYIDEKFVMLPKGADHSDFINPDKFESTIRGYILENGIVLYQGYNFRKIDWNNMTQKFIYNFKAFISENCIPGNYTICNGVHIGIPGEVWNPIEAIMKISINRKKEIDVFQRYI